jgi:uncharacterized protein
LSLVTAALAVLGGLVIGVLSGLMGVGGGIFLVPLLVLGFGFAQHLAQGTSLAAIIPTSIAGAVTHDRLGNVDRRAALWLAAGGVVGALAGALVAVQLRRLLLVRIFGAFLIYSAYRIWTGRARKVD